MILFGIVIFLLLSAFFSGAEIAFISASKLKIEVQRSEGSRIGKILSNFFDNSRSLLGTLLVGNNIALVILTYLLTKLFSPFLMTISDQYLFLLLGNTLLITVIVLIFGEFLPKTFFGLFADRILKYIAFPLLIMKYLLAFPVWVMSGLSTLILKYVFKSDIKETERIFTKIDLENFVKGKTNHHDEEINTELFENALHLNKLKVKDCMVPRKEIISIDLNEPISELIEQFKNNGVSRIIIVDEDIDNVLGYVHHQQLLKSHRSLKGLIMPVSFVPEVMNIYELLNRFIKERKNIACVVDEYGGTAGLITLEDILEELFGDIEDEHDREEYTEEKISESEYLFSGRLEVSYLNEKYPGLDLPEGEYSTLSGYIVMTTESLAAEGEEIILGNFRFIVESVSETKIETVRVIKIED
jgi:putative hemolysin